MSESSALCIGPSPVAHGADALMQGFRFPVFRLCLVREGNYDPEPISIKQPGDLAKFLAPVSCATEEHFISVHLNAKSQVIGLHEVSHGTLSASLVHPREVFKAALLSNSHSIIVCHNHPSGASLSPSREDFETTRQLVHAGRLIGVSVVDHLIVGPDEKEAWYSFRERNSEIWSDEFESDSDFNLIFQ